jgi:hydrophobe/amphiphile efflux-3 (HAE3) family protein
MRQVLERITTFGEQRPRSTLALFGVLALICAAIALSLQPSASINTFVSSSSADYQSTQTDYHQFGGDSVVVLVREPLKTLVGSADLGRLSELEACLAGEQVTASSSLGAFVPVPARQATPYGGTQSACGHLMADKPAQVVEGPATFLNQAVIAVNRQIAALLAGVKASAAATAAQTLKEAKARGLSPQQQQAAAQAAGQAVEGRQVESLESVALNSGLGSLTSLPSIDNTSFIETVVFDATRGAYTPKARFSYLFPNSDAALVQVRLRPDLSSTQTAQAIRWIKQATRMKAFALGSGGSYTVTGEPVVLNDVSASLSGQVALLLIGSVLVMGVVLLLVFRRRLRLLPLALALAAAAITFGVFAIAGGTLTMASIAVLPILIGLAVDYGIQFQSRASGAPTIAAAALATATGFLVLLLSPVPMVRGFGLLLVLGVGVALAVVLCAGSAALILKGPNVVLPEPVAASLRGAGELLDPRAAAVRPLGRLGARAGRGPARLLRALGPSLRGALELIVSSAGRSALAAGRRAPRTRVASRQPALGGALQVLSRRPRGILALGLLLALVGWVVDTQTSVQSDITKLVPANTPALHNLNTLERITGESGELDVIVHSTNVATPGTVAWMVRYENEMVQHFGYLEEKGCASAKVCPALSLPDLFSSSTSSSSSSSSSGSSNAGSSSPASTLTQDQINTLLTAVPSYFSQAVINRDRTYASLSFGIKLMPLSEQIRVVAYMRDHLDPPAGVTAKLAGLPVLAADADAALSSSSRRLGTLVAGLLAVALMLLAIFRNARRALTPLVPIVLATGWSALIVWLIGIPLNPMSATLGALVVAISTEFSVLLAERFRRQRADGEDLDTALVNAYRSTGKAVAASGITAIAGFAVLIVSNVTMLRDFGLVTLIDMSVSLLGVLVVLPAVLTLSERGSRLAVSGLRPRSPLTGRQPRLRRSRRRVPA